MDAIRISDAALASAHRAPDHETGEDRSRPEDSIDLIDQELRRMLDSKESDNSKEQSHASKFASNLSRHKVHETVSQEDRFASLMEQMEVAINAESLKPGPDLVQETKLENSELDGKKNSNWKTKREPTELERRRTLVKGRPPAGSLDKENIELTAQKPPEPRGWGVVDGKRLVKTPSTLQPISQEAKEVAKKQEPPREPEARPKELSFSLRRDSRSKDHSTFKETEVFNNYTKTNDGDGPIKKPKLYSEESYFIDTSLNAPVAAKVRPPVKPLSRADMKLPEPPKESKLSVQASILSPVAIITEQNDTKKSKQQLFLGGEISPLRQLSSNQKTELANCVADMKISELKGKLNFLLRNIKSKDCLVFIKIVMDVIREFGNERETIKARKEYSPVLAEMDNLATKVRELSKVLQTLSLNNDAKLTSAIIDSVSRDISSIITLISSLIGNYEDSSKHFVSTKTETRDRLGQPLKSISDDASKKGDDLEICLKKSTEKMCISRDNLSAKLDFDELTSEFHKISHETLPFSKDHNYQRKPQFDNFEAAQRRGCSRGPREERKEAEPILSQKFGCKLYCIKLMSSKLIIGFEDGTLSVFRVSKTDGLCLEKSGKLHPKPISSISCTLPEQRRGLIFTGYSGGSSCSIVVWDASSLKPLKELCGHTATISSLQYILPNYLITTSFDRKVIFWDLGECEAVLSSEVHQTPIISSYYQQETKCLFTGSLDGTIIVSGLMMDNGELTDLRIFKKIVGQGPVLSLTCCLEDRILSLQNSRLVVYDSRGFQIREIKTNTMPTSVTMIDEEKGFFVDAEGKPHPINLIRDGELRRDCVYTGSSLDKSSLVLGARLNGANTQVQMFFENGLPIIISSNEKLDALNFYRIK